MGRAIAERRTTIPLTQLELATLVGMSRASIANIERGKQTVSVHTLYAIALALNVDSPEQLLPPLRRTKPAGVEVKSPYATISASQEATLRRLIDSVSKTEGAKVRK